jgi:hypothetical protein
MGWVRSLTPKARPTPCAVTIPEISMPDRSTVALKALREIKELIGRPTGLSEKLVEWSMKLDLDQPLSVSEFLEWVQPASNETHVRQYFHGMISLWDYRPAFEWSNGTEPSSEARRHLICALLKLSAEEEEQVNRIFPVYPRIDQPIRVAADEPGAASWYDEQRREQNVFYWRGYERYLLQAKGWDSKNVAVLDSTSTDVVADLRDPLGNDARTTRGLVVGYVQSGKTANFTGVIAKAIDAGYRLIIVLAGLQNSLRNQTQRRIDKELVGKEILEVSGDEYSADDDWAEFNSYGDIPERAGAFNIDRLTTSAQDFRNPIGDLSRLRFHKAEPSLPFNHPRNLGRHPVKLIVIKKNKTPLTNLLKALRQAQSAGTPWAEVPSIIIDDESDQASLNSKKPSESERQQRTAINGLIVDILSVLQRGQYIGYTATPFANVFVSPDDAEDLFPSNFLSSLPRPEGYMGVQDFYDPRETPKNYPDPQTNYGCYVRPVKGEDGKAENLPRAIDAFVLSGAIKLFREAKDGRKYKHHTMLVHLTTSVSEHRLLKTMVDSMFANAAYATGGQGFGRLKTLWESDYQAICNAGRHDDGSVPAAFSDLKPFIGACVARIIAGGACTLILNGDDRENPPDFDKSSVWKIIVGGAKLSRGYTVEGLTVSYYRRVAGAADTLMQMGRWFGYRDGYRDLVRLYIGTDEPKGKKERVDLYEAFRGVCDDEEEFRSQLRMYSRLQGDQRLTPKQIPPLVPSHMLMPTAKNKMYNATVLFVNFGEEQKQSTVASTDVGIKQSNEEAMKTLLKRAAVAETVLGTKQDGKPVEFKAFAGIATPDDMKSFLHTYKFGATLQDQGQLPLIREYIEGVHGDPQIERWVVIAPQFANESDGKPWLVPGVGSFSIRRRERVGDGQRRYNVFTESRHVAVAEMLAGTSETATPVSPGVKALIGAGNAVMLFYPVLAGSENGQIPTMGFSLFFPKNKIQRRIRWGVRVKNRPADVTVELSP